MPDPDSCCNYYHCVSAEGFKMQCPPGLHFNAKLSVCDWPLRANCSGEAGGPVTSTPGSTGSPGSEVTPPVSPETTTPGTSVPIEPCLNLDPATHEFKGNCSMYYYCWQGYPYLVVCNKGEGYSEKDNACVADSSCSTGGETGGGGFTCPERYGTYAIPDNTAAFYYCYNFVLYTVACFTNQHYDDSIHGCALNSVAYP